MDVYNGPGSPGGQDNDLLEVFHTDSAGFFSISVLRQHQFTPERLLAAWLAGDKAVEALITAFNCLSEKIDAGSGFCFLDGAKLSKMPATLIWLMPHRADPHSTAMGGLCPGCAQLGDDEIVARSLPVLRLRWPNARAIDPVHISPTGSRV